MTPEIDLTVYLQAAAGGVPILFLVFGIVELLKRLQRSDGSQLLTGNALLLASLAAGLLLGLGFWINQTEPPGGTPWQVYTYWFAGAAYGLGLGLLASLFFDTLKGIVERAIARLGKQIPPPPSPMMGMKDPPFRG